MDDPAFSLASTIDINTQTILLHASNHDIPALKPLLRIPGNASVQDPETGFTPLHAAIAACGEWNPNKPTKKDKKEGVEGEQGDDEEDEEVDIEKACDTVRELLLSGAIWNDLDSNDETPGCLAWRLGWRDLYVLCVEAGVRAEVLLGLMGGYEELDSEDDEEEDDDGAEEETSKENPTNKSPPPTTADEISNPETSSENANPKIETEPESEPSAESPHKKQKRDVNSKDYLASTLKFNSNGDLLDADNNGVMMKWETEIMRDSVSRLLPSTFTTNPPQEGLKILNIGLGLGIIDSMFHALSPKPTKHHIIEAHPDVLSSLSLPSAKFGKDWESSGPADGNYKVHAGKWQTIIPSLLLAGEKYDIIYFDTFGESYTQLKLFFQQYIPHLLVPADVKNGVEGGKFGFFNGLGADRRVCYDVYMNVVEIDAMDVGLEVEWFDVDVGEEICGKGAGEGEWEGVRRRYWVLDTYRLPVLTLGEVEGEVEGKAEGEVEIEA